MHCFSRSSMFSMKMVLIHTLVSQRGIVMSSDSFVSIVLPMSILLCSITSARFQILLTLAFSLNIWQILDPFCCTDSCWNGWYSRNAESCCQDDELVCNEINYKDLPEKCQLGHLVLSKKHLTHQKMNISITLAYIFNIIQKPYSEPCIIIWLKFMNSISILHQL